MLRIIARVLVEVIEGAVNTILPANQNTMKMPFLGKTRTMMKILTPKYFIFALFFLGLTGVSNGQEISYELTGLDDVGENNSFAQDYQEGANEAATNLQSGLIAHWKFDDCTAKDKSGNGYNGVINGSPKCVTGVIGKALQFNGIKDFIVVADRPKLRLSGTSYTLSGWVLLKSYNSSYISGLIAKRGGGHQQGYAWSMTGLAHDSPNGRALLGISRGGDPVILSPTETPLNTWRHIAVTYDFNTNIAKLYINSALNTEASNIPSPNPNTSVPLIIARDNDSIYYLNGILDDLRVYNRVLSRSEISDLYNMGLPVSGSTNGLQQIKVTCKNMATGQTVTIPYQSSTKWNCKNAGLKTQPNQKINISIDGNTFP